jgi:ADP-L-glycero-D-manno-heptose 6-epimerase
VKELADKGLIEYIPFPQGLQDKYQSYTQADLSRLRGVGYPGKFMTVEEGVASYMRELER